MQKPLPPDCGFCAQVAGSESVHWYAPSMTTGFGSTNVPVQFTFAAPPWPALPRALAVADIVAPVRPTEPGAFPWPLFQWYVTICVRQYDLPFVSNVGGLPPFSAPPPFVLSKTFTAVPGHAAVALDAGDA